MIRLKYAKIYASETGVDMFPEKMIGFQPAALTIAPVRIPIKK